MDKGIEKIYQMPHNQLRKAMCIGQCIRNLKGLQRGYAPIFDEDEFVNSLLEKMRTEKERILESLRQEKDVDALFQAAFKEES